MLDHKKVEVQSVLAVGCDKPLIERQLRRRGRPVAVGVLRENALQVPVQKVPDFLFVVHYLLKSLHYRSISRNDSALPGRGPGAAGTPGAKPRWLQSGAGARS